MEPTPPPPPPPSAPPPGYYPPPYPPPFPPPRKASLLWLWILLGLFGALMVIGILAAVAIPSFMDYQKKAKRSEAELSLWAIGKGAKMHYAENAQFPTQSSEPTPPLGACCAAPARKCPPSYQQWTGGASAPTVWDELDFEMSESHYFSYSYEGSPDGQSFVARAHGDLDCDGNFAVYELRGTARGGVPEVELVKPTRPD